MERFGVILAAAGRSTRFMTGQNPLDAWHRLPPRKIYADLAGKPVWKHSADAFLSRSDVGQIVLVISPDDREAFQEQHRGQLALLGIDLVDGGSERADSVERGLAALRLNITHVAVHDAARPLVTRDAIDRVFATAREFGAAILATPIVGTIKRVQADDVIETTVPREGLWEAQTPQVSRVEWLRDAFEQRGERQPTDEAQLLQEAGYPVRVVLGDRTNLKITTADDLQFAGNLLPKASPSTKPRSLFDDEDDE
jgi:2-C-methyl-D-erythritol 4-phosphate cytidylyltransferase